jgi:hypothetical protein
MMNSKKSWISIVAALAFGLLGCDSSSSSTGSGGAAGSGGGTVGAGGDAGAGGAPAAGASVTAVHLAPEVPNGNTDDTEVAIFVNGANSGVTISYGETTGRIPLATGTYDLALACPMAPSPCSSFRAWSFPMVTI